MSNIRRLMERVRRVQEGNSKPLLRQAIEITNLKLRNHLAPAEYYAYGLHGNGRTYQDMARYVPGHQYWHQLLPKLNQREWIPILANKWLYHKHLDGLLPLPRLLGLLHPTNGLSADGAPIRSAAELLELLQAAGVQRVVLKPIGGSMGFGVIVADHVDGDGIRVGDRLLTPEQIDTLIAAADAGLIVEERLQLHPFFLGISPNAPSTMRVVTLLRNSGDVLIPFARVRFGRAGSMVDNTAQGGFAVRVDVATGALHGLTTKVDGLWTQLPTHPDSGERIEGMVIPDWENVLQLVRRAARLLPGLKSVGWDVLPTPGGPMLIEGNHDWDLVGQQVYEPWLANPEFAAFLAENGIEFNAERLPPVRLYRK